MWSAGGQRRAYPDRPHGMRAAGDPGCRLVGRARALAAGNASSIAVVPFKTVGGGGEYLADGLTESLTTEWGRSLGYE